MSSYGASTATHSGCGLMQLDINQVSSSMAATEIKHVKSGEQSRASGVLRCRIASTLKMKANLQSGVSPASDAPYCIHKHFNHHVHRLINT